MLPQIPFNEWMLNQAIHLKTEVFEKLLMIIWGLWTNRNTNLWEDPARTTSDIFFNSMTWLEEFQKSNTINAAWKQRITHIWQPTFGNEFKLNMDGPFIPQLTRGGIGGVP
ncbi:hypothetical protein RchiOBHm_Chr5g0044911 [Rosa chinensis]|uniref:Uncharacterized protein n=1 Tax=Rosa chinensis TaxID=74649 RepID=A0A2P6QDP4_ROSCH|nr:hypothetical protein RchiOBHm_Chr5g0044911 [Rosa chinensis]